MAKNKFPLNKWALLTIILMTAAMGIQGMRQARLDTNILNALPTGDGIYRDAQYVMAHNPLQDQLVIDLRLTPADADRLVNAADHISQTMAQSGLFQSIGLAEFAQAGPQLPDLIVQRLPHLFTATQLEQQIAPLLTRARIHQAMDANWRQLGQIDGIGQIRLLAADPLAFRNVVFKRLAALLPTSSSRYYRGYLLSADRTHLLLPATPNGAGTDTAIALPLENLFSQIENQLAGTGAPPVQMTVMGTFRAALDNERMARRDVKRAIMAATIGIALLLWIAFPRPWIGLLALLPAIFGTAAAFWLFSLIHPRISVLTLGFGGAVISITVDHGIAFLLFLDHPGGATSQYASREIRAVGLIAALTSMGAFLSLSFSGFPILAQIGQFAALGIGCSYLFIHTLFAWLIPSLPPTGRPIKPLQQWINRATGSHISRISFWPALALAIMALPLAWPGFEVDLKAFNSMQPETQQAATHIQAVWGNVMNRSVVLIEADSPAGLQQKNDALVSLLDMDASARQAFVLSALFPGDNQRAENLNAWQLFWQRHAASTRAGIQSAAARLGFTANAFDPFLNTLTDAPRPPAAIPAAFFSLLGITPAQSTYRQVVTLPAAASAPAAASRVETVFRSGLARIFDPNQYAGHIGRQLATAFIRMALIIFVCVTLLLLLFFRSIGWTLSALAAPAYGFVCTLALLTLLGRPLDIASLMLSIVILGMGIDYALFMICAKQRYKLDSDDRLARIRLAVLLAGASSALGFGTLALADQAMLQSVGICAAAGISFTLLGTFLILPAILDWRIGK